MSRETRASASPQTKSVGCSMSGSSDDVVVPEESRERLLPHVCRDLEKFLHEQVDQPGRDVRGRRLNDERARRVRADRIVQVGNDGLDEVEQLRVVTKRRGRRFKDQSCDPIRMIESNPPRNERRARVARQHHPLDAEGVEKGYHVGREVLDAISPVGLVGITVPALRHGDGAYLARQEIKSGLVGAPRVGWPGE